MNREKLKLSEKIGYGFGDAASSMFWKLFGMYIMFFYTDIFGIPAAVVGTMFLVTRIGDSFFDPLVGIISDRTETRWGKFRPYLLWMALPFGIIGVLTFTTPPFDTTGKIIYAYVTFSLMMLVYSMINVPYASLMGVMTADGKERTTLATYRFIFAFGGSFLVLGLFQPLFDSFGTNNLFQFSNPKEISLSKTDSTFSDENKIIVWDNKSTPNEVVPVDSFIYLTVKVSTRSNDEFKLGIYNTKNNQITWVTFPAGKDTLGLLRDGSWSKVQINLKRTISSFSIKELAYYQLAFSGSNEKIKIGKAFIQEINYQYGTQKAVIVIAIIAVLMFLLTFFLTKERIKPLVEKPSLKDDLKDLAHNTPWFILLGASVSTIFFNTIRDGAAVYYFKYYYQGKGEILFNTINLSLAISTVYLLLGQAANIIGVILAKPVSDRFGKKSTFLAAMLIATVLSFLFYGLDKTNLTLILIFQFFISISAGIIFPLVWSMYADTADYSEWVNGRRATGLVFSAASMSQKLGASIGIALAGWLLALFGYQANVAQTIETQNGIRMMLSFIPGIGALLAAIFMFYYPLNEKKLKQIEEELEKRRNS
ncbi:MAG: MFS transporter [Bacteroidales bacterium]|nr:MFS transporter [Bacteroidales bacterium]